MQTVSYFGNPDPGMKMEVTHFYCQDEDEQNRLIAYYELSKPEFKPLANTLNKEMAREEIPFLHHSINASSAEGDRFFKIKWIKLGGKDWTPDGMHVMPVAIERAEWLDLFEQETGWFAAHR